jgi:GNAT superfamily N-acetyltransferase
MYVMPDYRGKGINGKLIDGLIDWSKNKGLQEVQLDVYFENTNALKAYHKKGFQPSLLNMSLNI